MTAGHSRGLRTVLTSLFVLLMLASAHLFMVGINAAERSFAAPQPAAGIEARVVPDGPLADEIARAELTARTDEDRRAIAAGVAAARDGQPVELRTLPVTPFIVGAALTLTALGLLLLWLTVKLRSDAAQSILGIFAGNLIWTGAVEYGLTIASRSLGVGKAVAVVDGQLFATYGEYVLLKHSWGAMVLVLAYILFLESSRCPAFLFFRKRLPLMRGALISGGIGNYGPRSAFQYTSTVWFFYLLLLWTYDENVAGVHSLVTNTILVASMAGAVYFTWRLNRQPGWGPAIRYAVGAMVVAWTPVEILGKWGVFDQPWLLFEPTNSVLFFGGLGLGTWALWRAARRPKRESAPTAQPLPQA